MRFGRTSFRILTRYAHFFCSPPEKAGDSDGSVSPNQNYSSVFTFASVRHVSICCHGYRCSLKACR